MCEVEHFYTLQEQLMQLFINTLINANMIYYVI